MRSNLLFAVIYFSVSIILLNLPSERLTLWPQAFFTLFQVANLAEGNALEPDGSASGLVFCDQCRRIIDQMTGAVLGFRSPEATDLNYNTRDVFAFNVTSGHCPAGTTEKVDCWPMPEVRNNIDMTTGNLALTDQEENQIVAFLQTLTDGFTKPFPNINTFTGACMTTNETASTQGNAVLIPTPPLPPCAPEVCGVAPVPNPPIP
jgi:hypothetical protein